MIMRTVQRAIDDVNPGVTFTPEGYARAWLRIVDPSLLYDYGTHTAEVPVQTATDPAALATLIGKPVTIDHPPDFVGPDTIRHLRHGTVLGYEVVGGEPYAWVQIESPELLAHGRACGWRLTCSPGYDFSEAPSDVADFAQTDRRYNHLAICVTTQPRGGSRCRTILTATDGVPVEGAPLERDKLIALLIGKGVPEADAGVLADELIASMAGVKVEIEDMAKVAADMKPDPAMDALRKAADAKVAAVQKAADAEIKAAKAAQAAAEKRANDAEIARAGERVRRAADGLGLGKDATDVQKLAEQVADKCAVPHKGLYAVAFAEGLGSAQKPGKAADGAWKMTPENDGKPKGTDSAEDAEPTPSSMEC